MRQSVISRVFYRISSALEPYGKVVLLVAVAIILVAGYRFSNQRLDLSAASLIPDSSPELVRISEFLDINPSSRVTLVEFRSQGADDGPLMQEMAGELEAALGDYMEESKSRGLPRPEKLIEILPYLFDEEARVAIESTASPEDVDASIKRVREGMLGLYGFAPKEYLRADPLGWLNIFTSRVSAELFQGSSFNPASLSGYPVSEDGKYVLLILRPKSDLYDVQSAEEIMTIMETTLDRLLTPHDGRIEALIVGGPRYTAENAITIQRDLKVTVALSLICLAVIYLFTVRSLGAIWLLLTPVVAVIFSGGALTLVWPTTAGLALAFGAAVLGIAVDFAVLVHFALRRNTGKVSRPGIIAAVARPMVFSASLCIASFCVMFLSSVPALRQLGFFAAASLFFGVIIATMILPYCPWADKPRLKSIGEEDRDVLGPKLLPTVALWLLLASTSAWGLMHVPFDSSLDRLGMNTEQIKRELTELRSHWNEGSEPYFWLSRKPNQDAALEDAYQLVKVIRSEGGVAFSLSDVLPPARVQKENLARWSEFIGAQGGNIKTAMAEASANNGFKPAAFRGFENWLTEQSEAALAGRIAYTPDALENLLNEAGLGDIFWWLSASRDDGSYVFTYSDIELEAQALPVEIRESTLLFSMNDLTAGIMGAFDKEIRMLPIAGLVCLALLALCFRKPLTILLACLPPLFGLTAVVMWQYFSGHSLTLAGVAALTLVIGLGADYGIVMLHELGSKMSFGAFRSILVSGLTTLSGLGVLILAKHPVLHELGSITFFGLSAEMLAVLLVVPFLSHSTSKRSPNA